MEIPLDHHLRHAAGSLPLILTGLAAAGGLLVGVAFGRRLRGRQQYQSDDESVDLHAADRLTDALTGLAGHRAFETELAHRVDEFHRDKTPFCLLLIDVDHFKQFNDIHDHLAGDDVLRMISRTLKAAVREADFIARCSGEEFVILMPQTTLPRAVESAQRIRAAIEQTMCDFGGRKLKTTVSIGVAQAIAQQSPAAIMQSADAALYAAKQAGCNQVHHYPLPAIAASAAPTQTAGDPGKSLPASAHSPTKAPHISPAPSHRSALPTTSTRTDVDTGLPNRAAFCEEIRRRLSEAQRHGNRLSLMLIKIDNLTRQSHQQAPHDFNLMLRSCAQFLTAAMRDMDLVVRYDVDVFGMMLPGTALTNATGVGERLRKTIQQCPLRINDIQIHFTLSAGVAESQPGEDLALLLKRVESATAAAAAGGNGVRFHNGVAVETSPEKITAMA